MKQSKVERVKAIQIGNRFFLEYRGSPLIDGKTGTPATFSQVETAKAEQGIPCDCLRAVEVLMGRAILKDVTYVV